MSLVTPVHAFRKAPKSTKKKTEFPEYQWPDMYSIAGRKIYIKRKRQ